MDDAEAGISSRNCEQRHMLFMSIRYNCEFCDTHGQALEVLSAHRERALNAEALSGEVLATAHVLF
jgi:hypothetical protein